MDETRFSERVPVAFFEQIYKQSDVDIYINMTCYNILIIRPTRRILLIFRYSEPSGRLVSVLSIKIEEKTFFFFFLDTLYIIHIKYIYMYIIKGIYIHI